MRPAGLPSGVGFADFVMVEIRDEQITGHLPFSRVSLETTARRAINLKRGAFLHYAKLACELSTIIAVAAHDMLVFHVRPTVPTRT